MKPGLHVVQDKSKQVLAGIKSLQGLDVLVGIPGDNVTGSRGPQTGSNLRTDVVEGAGPVFSDVTNAILGIIHEFGAPEMNIPPRAFLIPGVRNEKKSIAKYLGLAVKAAMKGDKTRVMRALNSAGMVGMMGAKRKITTGPFVPLKPATVAKRRIRSKGSSYRRKASTAADVTPLIDTGQLRNALTYILRKSAGARS